MQCPYLVLDHSVLGRLELDVEVFLDKDGPRLLIEPIARCVLVELHVEVPEQLGKRQTRLRISQVLAQTLVRQIVSSNSTLPISEERNESLTFIVPMLNGRKAALLSYENSAGASGIQRSGTKSSGRWK